MEEYKHPPLPEGMEDPDKDKDPIYIKYRNILLQKMRRTNWEDEINKIVLRRTSIPSKKLKECKEKKIDWFMHAKEALKYKCVDKIL